LEEMSMTEEEWFATTDPQSMVLFLRDRVSDRKLRLFGCACYRLLWQLIPVSENKWDVLRSSESYADGMIAKQEFKLIRKKVVDWKEPKVSGEAWEVALSSARDCLGETLLPPSRNPDDPKVHRKHPENLGFICQLMHDIFGNPFRLVILNHSWLTSTVRAISQQMYDSRDFSAMPILADALQDVGCDNDEILNHCRDPNGVHVRGCWVVDLSLNKT
jgi:hypothetical protein